MNICTKVFDLGEYDVATKPFEDLFYILQFSFDISMELLDSISFLAILEIIIWTKRMWLKHGLKTLFETMAFQIFTHNNAM